MGAYNAIDFDAMTIYPHDYNPSFAECYDLTGEGLESPFLTSNMGVFKDHEHSVSRVLRVYPDELLEALREVVERDLRRVLSSARRVESECSLMIQASRANALSEIASARNTPRGPFGNVFELPVMDIEDKSVLLIGTGYANLFMELMQYSPKSVIFLEPSGETVREIQRFLSMNDRSGVCASGGREFIETNLKRRHFDAVFFQDDGGVSLTEYVTLSSSTVGDLVVHVEKGVDETRVDKYVQEAGFSNARKVTAYAIEC